MNESVFFLAAAGGCFCGSVLHLMIIVGGSSWYRYFGAGEALSKMAEAGHWYPAVITAAIALVLALWGIYALSHLTF